VGSGKDTITANSNVVVLGSSLLWEKHPHRAKPERKIICRPKKNILTEDVI
jgi:hypothetical protein